MKKILVIDDVDMARNVIRRMLEKGGYEVLEAANGKKGLKMIEQHAPDAVIMDILMPEMEGIETIRILTKTKPALPIVVITASIDTPYLQMAIKFGAVCGLYKPFKQAELLSAVRKALDYSTRNT
jgi:CheY-like chemotaxis protein